LENNLIIIDLSLLVKNFIQPVEMRAAAGGIDIIQKEKID